MLQAFACTLLARVPSLASQLKRISSMRCAQQELKHVLATVEELDASGLGNQLTAHGVKAPETGNDLSPPFPFNLMFKTSIGPRSDQVGYLRPETAQGIFVNFRYACCPR